MASGPITSWEIGGETVETVGDFVLGGLQNHFLYKILWKREKEAEKLACRVVML